MAYLEPHGGMEMPCPCQKCHGWFDLHDGTGSEKWFPDTVICDECAEIERQEIETEEEIKEVKSDIEDAEITIKDSKERLAELEAKLKLLQEHDFEPTQD